MRVLLPAGRTSLAVFISLGTEESVGAQRALGCQQREDPRPHPGPAWQFLVLAAYELQLSKEVLVPVGTLSDPRDNGSA